MEQCFSDLIVDRHVIAETQGFGPILHVRCVDGATLELVQNLDEVYRGASVAVRLTPTQVTIRNLYRTHVLNRAEVAEWILVDVHVWGQPAVAQCVGARVGGREIKALGTFRLGDRGGDRMLRFFGVPLD